MGIIVINQVATPFGENIENSYVSFAENAVQVFPSKLENGTKVYQLQSTAFSYVSKAARNDNKRPFTTAEIIAREVTNLDDVYAALYVELKKKFTDFTDEI